MIAFSERSTESEIIDDMTLDDASMARVCHDLEVVNRFLGGYRVTLDALERLLPRGREPVRILDVGAGGGDMARAVAAWATDTGRKVDIVAVDLSHGAARFASDATRDVDGVHVVQGDVYELPFRPATFDVVMCALFLHHFDQQQAARLLRAMFDASRLGVIVNDLHRHPLAYAGIWSLTRILPASPIVRHDGPLSVLRAFDRRDFDELARATGLPMSVRWRWAFRYQVTIPKANGGNGHG